MHNYDLHDDIIKNGHDGDAGGSKIAGRILIAAVALAAVFFLAGVDHGLDENAKRERHTVCSTPDGKETPCASSTWTARAAAVPDSSNEVPHD